MYLIYYSYICFFVVQNSGKENLQLCIHRSRRKDVEMEKFFSSGSSWYRHDKKKLFLFLLSFLCLFSLLRRRPRKQNYHKKGVSALGRILKSFSSFANRSLLCGSGLMTPLDRMGGAASRELLRLEEEVDSSSSSTTITTHTPTAPE